MHWLEHLVASVVLASVRRTKRDPWQVDAVRRLELRSFYEGKGRYVHGKDFRSLLFKVNSWNYHQVQEAQRSEIERLSPRPGYGPCSMCGSGVGEKCIDLDREPEI